jgi:F0F1-type ATP synthase assembly protein I
MNDLVSIHSLSVWNLLLLVQSVLFIVAMITILVSRRYTGGGKLVWVLLVFVLPVVGPIVWLIWGRRAQFRNGTL